MSTTNCTCEQCNKVWSRTINPTKDYTILHNPDEFPSVSVWSGVTPDQTQDVTISKAKYDRLERQYQELGERYNKLLQELHDTQRALSERADDLDQELAHTTEAEQQCNELAKQLDKKEDVISQLQHKRMEDVARINNQFAEIAQLHKEIAKRDEGIAQLKSKVAELQDDNEHMIHEDYYSALETENKSLLETYQAALDAMSEATTKISDYEQELRATNTELRARERQIEELRSAISILAKYL